MARISFLHRRDGRYYLQARMPVHHGETARMRVFRSALGTWIDYRLLQGIAEGKRIGPIAIELAREQPDADLGVAFERLLDSGAVLRLQKEENPQ
ncbi:hypothetical protein MSC49_03500 [Methylosinus sp. C49]|nr:hypothetical protein MSC49_03500 [Methylosinus sp. C49]